MLLYLVKSWTCRHFQHAASVGPKKLAHMHTGTGIVHAYYIIVLLYVDHCENFFCNSCSCVCNSIHLLPSTPKIL